MPNSHRHPDTGSVYAIDWHSDRGVRDRQNSSRGEVHRQLLFAHSFDRDTGVWTLCVRPNGETILRLNDRIVGVLAGKKGASILNTVECPFEGAAMLIASVSSNLQTLMGDATRTDFEFAVAKWIPRYFEA